MNGMNIPRLPNALKLQNEAYGAVITANNIWEDVWVMNLAGYRFRNKEVVKPPPCQEQRQLKLSTVFNRSLKSFAMLSSALWWLLLLIRKTYKNKDRNIKVRFGPTCILFLLAKIQEKVLSACNIMARIFFLVSFSWPLDMFPLVNLNFNMKKNVSEI